MQVRKSFFFLAQANPRKFIAFLTSLFQGDRLAGSFSLTAWVRKPQASVFSRAAVCRGFLVVALISMILPKVIAQYRESTPPGDLARPSLRAKADVKMQSDRAPANPGSPHPISVQRDSPLSRFGVAFKTSTLGLGGDLGVRVVRPINLRVGFSTFHFTADLNHDGTPYEGSLRLYSLQTIVDWFPFAGSYHVSPGLIFNNHNHITARATPPLGQVQTSGDIKYISDPRNPITGNALSAVRKVAPVLLAGFGNLLPRNHHFAYSIDFGVVYQGHPKSNFALQGAACDPSGVFCADIANDIDTRRQVAAAERDLNKTVSTFMRFYPVVSVEFGYRF